MWKTLELCTRKVVDCCKQGMTILFDRILKDKSAGTIEDCGGPAQELSKGNNINIGLEAIDMIF